MVSKNDIDNWFTYHAPEGRQIDDYKQIRMEAKQFALTILELTPPGADQEAALRRLRETVMAANLAIACGPKIDGENEEKVNVDDVVYFLTKYKASGRQKDLDDAVKVLGMEQQFSEDLVKVLESKEVDPKLFEIVRLDFCIENKVLPLKMENGVLYVAMSDLKNYDTMDKLRFIVNMNVDAVRGDEDRIMEVLLNHRDTHLDPEVAEAIMDDMKAHGDA
jgi:hypothetical protein